MQQRFFTTFAASRFLGVSLPTVVNWIKDGRLRAHRTPGGHRRIARDELASFIRRHGMPMPPELEGEGTAARVMVVHEDAGQGQQIAGLVKRAGFSGTAVSDPFTAGLQIGLSRPDLVILDLGMKGLAAGSLATELRRHDETSTVALLGLVGAHERVSKKAGAVYDELVAKPLELPALKKKVELALRTRRAAR